MALFLKACQTFCATTAMSDAGSQFPHLSVEGLIFPVFPIHAQFAKLPPTRSTFPPDQFHGTKELFSQYSFSVRDGMAEWGCWVVFVGLFFYSLLSYIN